MKRKFVQIAALCLSIALFMASGGGQTGSAASSGASGKIIRVGLHHDGSYGTGAMEGLNMANSTGAGFRFGYYNSANQFTALGSTTEKAVSVVKTMNVCYGTLNGYTSYHSGVTSSVAVGEYHLQASGPYSTFAAAQSAAAKYEGGFPAYIGGEFYARIGNYTTRAKAVEAQEAFAAQGVSTVLKGTSEYSVNVVVTGTNTILFQFDDLGKGTGLGVEPNGSGAGKYVTLSKNKLYYGGFRFERIGGKDMTVVNMVDFEDYVKGVVATEMSTSWPVEALKAQAVAARSYAATLGTRHNSSHFDICDNTHCQAYTGQTRAGANSDAAGDQTVGQYAMYNGKVAETFYYSSNGGASEGSANVWGGSQSSYPYLVGRPDPYEAKAGVSNDWTKTVTSSVLVTGMKKLGYTNIGSSIVSIAVTSLTESGNPRKVTFTDSNGKSYSIDTRYVVGMLSLRSYRYGFSAAAIAYPSGTDAGPGDGVNINGSTTVDGTSGLYAIDGNGNVSAVDGDAYVITSGGVTQLEPGSGGGTGTGSSGAAGSLSSTTGSNGSFTFIGRGWGHNVGMSQYGAYAMANMGWNYQQILQFYYTGITVGYM